MLQTVSILYYLLSAFLVVILASNFWKSDDLQEEILYAFVALPFILRILHIK